MALASRLKQLGKNLVKRVEVAVATYPLPDTAKQNVNQTVDTVYRVILNRRPDPGGLKNFAQKLSTGELDVHEMVGELLMSAEFRNKVRFADQNFSLHESRCQFVRMMPRAAKILDLGGSSQNDPKGAMVVLGYPYKFEDLVIVELPSGESHSLYTANKHLDVVPTELGPVRYEYHSMADLTRYADASFDMVVSGQTIEHVSEELGDQVLREAFRVLKPGGYLCLDTPNGRVCRMQMQRFINDDHKIEYTHAQLSAKIRKAGFVIEFGGGLNYAGDAAVHGKFDRDAMTRNFGVFHDADNCYLLAYICRKPT